MISTIRGRAPAQYQQHLCLDKADYPTDCAAVEAANSIPHLRRIGEEQLDQADSNAGRSSSATTSS